MVWHHGLPEEDGVFDLGAAAGASALPPDDTHPSQRQIAIVAYPRISNLDEFQPLKNIPGLRLQWVRSPSELASLGVNDWIILPGSKATRAEIAGIVAAALSNGAEKEEAESDD